MLAALHTSGEVLVGGYSALAAVTVATLVYTIRTRERLAKVEEWQRLHELERKRDNGRDNDVE